MPSIAKVGVIYSLQMLIVSWCICSGCACRSTFSLGWCGSLISTAWCGIAWPPSVAELCPNTYDISISGWWFWMWLMVAWRAGLSISGMIYIVGLGCVGRLWYSVGIFCGGVCCILLILLVCVLV